MNEEPKPVIVIQTGCMSEEDIEALRHNGCCVVEADDPEQVRSLMLIKGSYEPIEIALIELSRWVLQSPSRHEKKAILEKYAELTLSLGQ